MEPREMLEKARGREPTCIRGTVDQWIQTGLEDFIPISPRERDALFALIDALEAKDAIYRSQARQWNALTRAMSVDFSHHPESVPGRNVGECAVALIRRLEAENAKQKDIIVESQLQIRAIRERATEALEAGDA